MPTTTTSTTTGSASTAMIGVVLDPSGAPLAGERVLCCSTSSCIQLDSGQEGEFAFPLTPGTQVSVKTHADLFRIPRWGVALAAAEMPTSGGIDLGPLYVPELPPGTPFASADADPQTLDAGDGLELTLNRGDLQPDLGVVLNDLAARRIPQIYVPTYAELSGREVEAVYALHPFGTTSSSPVAARVPTALPPGTAVSFWAVDIIGGGLLGPIPGTSDGTAVQTDAGQGLELLTHLLITVP